MPLLRAARGRLDGYETRRLARHFDARDRWALALLIAFPVLLYLPYALVGHPVVPGDNLTQNLPLRFLAGNLLRAGHLPTWDPLIWTGTPLLAGWNAGAMYPGTALFAVLPDVAAWTVNLIAIPAIAATGMYLFLRRVNCGPFGAFSGAIVFTYTGFMTGQVVHLGLVQGTSLLPWMLLGLDGVFTTERRTVVPGYVALIAVTFGGCVLAGDPRATSNAAIAVIIFVLAWTFRKGRKAIFPLYASAIGLALGALLSAIQWLPGLGFLHTSQRGKAAYSFFSAGSVNLEHLAAMMLTPFLLGGNGNFSLPIYSGNYNLPELTMGCGIVALSAAAAYLPELLRQFDLFIRRQRDITREPRRRLGVWFAFVIIGLLLTLGTTTPLGHLLVHIPLYGSERLQNRNALFFDLGLAALVAMFVDDLARSRRDQLVETIEHETTSTSTSPGDLPIGTLASKLLATIPPLFAIALIGYAYASPISVQLDLGANPIRHVITRMTPILIPTVLVAAAIIIFVVLSNHLSLRQRSLLIGFILFADVGLYVANASYASVPSSVLAKSTKQSALIAKLDGPAGRFALYDPNFYGNGLNPPYALLAGVSDLNILQGNPSVQGYGSIVQGVYQTFTQTHNYEALNVTRLQGETFNTLDLKTLLTLPAYVAQSVAPTGALPTVTGSPGGAPNAAPWSLTTSETRSWILPGPKSLVRATLEIAPSSQSDASQLSIGFVDTAGKTINRPVLQSGGDVYVLAPSVPITAIIVTAPKTLRRNIVIDAAIAVTKMPSQRLDLNGALQGVLVPPHWRYATTVGPYLVYQNTETLGLAWLQSPRSHTPNTSHVVPGSVRVLASNDPSKQEMVVSTDSVATLVRSETYAPGWKALISPVGASTTTIESARRFGLVQAVDIRPGTYLVTWQFAPGQIRVGLVLSGLGLLSVVVLFVVYVRRKRDQQRSPAKHKS